MEKQFKRTFSFEIDRRLAKANDYKYKNREFKSILKRFWILIPALLLFLISSSGNNFKVVKFGVITILLSIWIITQIRKDLKKLRNNEYILKHGFLIPGIITGIDISDINILTLVKFTQNSQEGWAFFSIKTRLHQIDTSLKIGDPIPLTYLTSGETKDILYENIYFAPLLYGTSSNEVIKMAIDKIDEFEWNILERNTNKYTESSPSPQFLTGEDIHRYSLDKI